MSSVVYAIAVPTIAMGEMAPDGDVARWGREGLGKVLPGSRARVGQFTPAGMALRYRNVLVSMRCFFSSFPSCRRSVPEMRAAALMFPAVFVIKPKR